MTHNANEGAVLLIARLCDKNNESPWRGVQEALAGRTQKGIDQATRSVRKESMRVESVAQSEANP